MLTVVCVKQVPASREVKIDPVTKNLLRDSTEGIMNPFDRNAVEAALRLREQVGGRVVALSMGPPRFIDTLREAVALGCDQAALLSSRALGGADTLATAYTLAQAVEKIGAVDLVLFARHAVDADTGQVGPLTAEFLGRPQVTFVKALEPAEQGWLAATRLLENCEERVKVKLPAVVTVTDELNSPRYPTPIRIMKAARLEIPVWDEHDLGCDEERIGLKGSRTAVARVFAPPRPARTAESLGGRDGLVREAAARLVEVLIQRGILR